MLEVCLQKRLAHFHLDVTFTTGQELTVLFGPSGSGKSLTLRMLAGVERPDSGYIRLDGTSLYESALGRHLAPQQRGIGYVPQQYGLFPHLTVADNIAFGLTHLTRQTRRQRVAELLELFGMQGLEHRLPRQLSGGQQQRVALARALAVQPRLLLLDEPFAALDGVLRDTLRQELMQVHARWGITVLVVTHDLADVYALGQQILVYDRGRILQQGTQEDVFMHPQTPRVAEFVHTRNILSAVVERSEAQTLWLRWHGYVLAAPPQPLAVGTSVHLCIRPSQVLIVRPERETTRRRENLVRGSVVRETMQTETYTVYMRVDHSDADSDLEIHLPSYVYYRLGLDRQKRLLVELRREAMHLIPSQETAHHATLPTCTAASLETSARHDGHRVHASPLGRR
ncbi:MAG: ABC transporter ATP-binding protein [Candidatus Tectomicrobia bacterium]|uniref:ABC transporter ATP-binding protein n=1 Tax=Tectimicrobiota bacterium TaxID=2528274 RepID=A0A937VZL4_UNCTE|nr:ABC transporter ATP-binding protein [Candidatus Tectomicrobia bacterium]